MNRYGQTITAVGEDFRVADRLEIMDVVWRFMMALDIGDRDMFESCVADRILWDLSNNPVRFSGGPADFGPVELSRADFVAAAFGRAGIEPSRELFFQHIVDNPLISFTAPDTATLLAHMRNPVHRKITDEDGRQHAIDRPLGGLYHMDACRQDGRWRVSALRLSVFSYDPAAMVGRE